MLPLHYGRVMREVAGVTPPPSLARTVGFEPTTVALTGRRTAVVLHPIDLRSGSRSRTHIVRVQGPQTYQLVYPRVNVSEDGIEPPHPGLQPDTLPTELLRRTEPNPGIEPRTPHYKCGSAPCYSAMLTSGWRDSNPRSPGPKPGALAKLRYTQVPPPSTLCR